jgi:hypothetical protein
VNPNYLIVAGAIAPLLLRILFAVIVIGLAGLTGLVLLCVYVGGQSDPGDSEDDQP